MKRAIVFKNNQNFLMIPLFLLLFMLKLCLFVPNSEAREMEEVFPEIEGWKKSGEVETYTPATLYSYINGAAEVYLLYGFQELRVVEYLNEHNASIIVEMYHHSTPVHAFGIYSQERPTEGNFLNIGAQGYIEGPAINFVAGNTYVKITSYDVGEQTQEVLQVFAKKIAENFGDNASLPALLNCFPDTGKIQNSEKFIAQSFFGYEFLHSGFTANYMVDGKTFELFIIAGADSTDCEEMLRQYLQFTQYPQKDGQEDMYTLSDPHHGEVVLSWKGKYIWGIKGLDDKEMRLQYLLQIEKKLDMCDEVL